MKNTAKLKLCIIGGRSFGKTSLAVSLLNIADKTDGSITAIGSSAKILALKNEFLLSDGQLQSTGWQEIRQFTFKLFGEKQRAWNLHFYDYPGELFEKYIDEASETQWKRLWTALKNTIGLKKQAADIDHRVFDSQAGLKAFALMRQLEKADALVILVPADITDEKYQRDFATYKQKLGELIDKIHEHNPKIPICLAINKWDMLEKDTSELDEVLKAQPFHTFFNLLSARCSENFFPMAISAFGKHKNDKAGKPTLADRNGVPVNVLEMLLEIADKAEALRHQQFIAESRAASFWRKTFIFPFQSWRMNRMGCSVADTRETLTKIARRAWLRFAAVSCGIIVTLGLMGFASWSGYEYMELERLKSEIAQSRQEYIKKDDIGTWKNRASQNNLPRMLLFTETVMAINKDINATETAYNERIISGLNQFLNAPDNKDLTYDTQKNRPFAPEERRRRLTERKRKIAEVLPLLTLPDKEADLKNMEWRESELLKAIDTETPLDDELIRVYSASEEDRCRKAEELIQRIAKGELPRNEVKLKSIQDELESWESSLQSDLEKVLALSPDNEQGTDWKKRQMDAEKRIKTIEKWEIKFSQNSKWRQTHQELINKENTLIGELELYGPFDDALRQLNQHSIRDIAAFLSTYNVKDYERRSADIGKMEMTSAQLVQAEMEKIDTAVAENDYSDKSASMQIRIDKANKIITACRSAMTALVENGKEYLSCQARVADITSWIDDHKKYIDFDNDWTETCAASKNDRIRKIDEFMQTYTAEEYPEYAERINAARSQRHELKKEIQDELVAALTQDKEKHAQGAWETLVSYAQERIKRIDSYRSRLGSDSENDLRQLKNVEDETIKLLTRDGKFNDAWADIEKAPDNILLIRIADFRKQFRKEDYADKEKIFSKMQQLEQDCATRLEKALSGEDEKIAVPEGKEKFAEWSEYYAKRLELIDESISQYPDGSSQKTKLTADKKEYESELQKYKSWAALKTKAAEIEARKGKDTADVMLASVGIFLEEFSDDFGSIPEVSAIFGRIREIQREAESDIGREVEEQLKQWNGADTREERLVADAKQLRIIEDNLHRFISGSDSYKLYQVKASRIASRMDAAQKLKRLEAAYGSLTRKLTETSRANEKIRLIDDFLGLYPKVEYPQNTAWFSELENQRTRLQREDAWAEVADKAAELNKEISAYASRNDLSSSDYSDLKTYRKKCDDAIKNINEYKSDFKDSAGRKIGELEKSIALITGLIGDGSFKSIQDLEKKYKAAPDYDNYKMLKNAIATFDTNLPGNSKYADSVEEIRKNLEENQRLALEMGSKFKEFKGTPSQNSFANFRRAVWEYNKWVTGENEHGQKVTSGYESKDVALNNYVNFVKTVSAINFKASWISFDFTDTNFSSWSDNDVELHVNGASKVRIRDINTNSWEKSRDRYKTESGNCEFSITLSHGESLEVKLINYTGVNTEGTDSVSFWNIIAAGASSEEYDCNFHIRGNGGKTTKATITLRFSGLPRLAE